jgi:hypothetical protein
MKSGLSYSWNGNYIYKTIQEHRNARFTKLYIKKGCGMMDPLNYLLDLELKSIWNETVWAKWKWKSYVSGNIIWLKNFYVGKTYIAGKE